MFVHMELHIIDPFTLINPLASFPPLHHILDEGLATHIASYMIMVAIRVETGSSHPGHVLSWSSGYDSVYKISGLEPDSSLDYVHY